MKKITKADLIKVNSIALGLMICGLYGRDFAGFLGVVSSIVFSVGCIVLFVITGFVKIEE